MSLFHRKRKHRRVFVGDSIDDNPTLKWSELGWQTVPDVQDYDQLHNEVKHDALAHKIVYKPAEDATRNGFRLVIPDDPDKQQLYQQALDKLKVAQRMSQQETFRRADGDGYLVLGIMENNRTSMDTPLVPDNIQDIAFIHAFGQNHIDSYRTNDDPTSPNYGKEQAIVLRPQVGDTQIDKNGNQVPQPTDLAPRVIDASRYFHTSLDKSVDDETGTSILTRCADQLKAMDIALSSTGKMLREFVFKVVKSDSLMQEPEDDYRKDRQELGQILNTESMMFLHNEDSVEKVATPTSGIDVLYNFIWQQLSAACGIPKSVLTGEQAGTLAGASQDVVNYYDDVKSIQNDYMKPEIEQIVKILMWASNVAGGSEDPDSFPWHIEFNPLWSADDKTKSETFLNVANAVTTLQNAGTIDPTKAANIIAGQNDVQTPAMTPETETDSIDTSEAKKLEKRLKEVLHGKTKSAKN